MELLSDFFSDLDSIVKELFTFIFGTLVLGICVGLFSGWLIFS